MSMQSVNTTITATNRSLLDYQPPVNLRDLRIWTLTVPHTGRNGEIEKKPYFNTLRGRLLLADKALGKQFSEPSTKREAEKTIINKLCYTWPELIEQYKAEPNKYLPIAGIVSFDVLAIDVDYKDSLPPEMLKEINTGLPRHLKELVERFPTVYHRSMSGKGWRILYLIDQPMPVNSKRNIYRNGKHFGEIFLGSFVTTIDNKYSDFSGQSVASITQLELSEFVPEILQKHQKTTHQKTEVQSKLHHNPKLDYADTVNKVTDMLTRIPPYITTTLETVYATKFPELNLSTYDHWLHISLILSDLSLHFTKTGYASAEEKFKEIFTIWSEQDKVKFKSTADCHERFEESLRENQSKPESQKLTISTLRKMYHWYKVPVDSWPVVKIAKDGTKSVDAHAVKNYEFIAEEYNIQKCHDIYTDLQYIRAPKGIIKSCFTYYGQPNNHIADSLSPEIQPLVADGMENMSMSFERDGEGRRELSTRLTKLAQEVGLHGARPNSNTTHIADHRGTQKIDLLFEWMTYQPWDGKPRVMSIIEKSVTLDTPRIPSLVPDDFCHKLILKHLIISAGLRERALISAKKLPLGDYEYKGPQGILIFAGPPKTRKSTWVAKLLPSGLSQYQTHFTPSHAKTDKDLQVGVSGSFVFNLNEVDAILNKYMDISDFKNFVNQDKDDYRKVFGVSMKEHFRGANLYGSTNSNELRLDRSSNRRIWIVPIKMCNADPLLNNQQQMWAELLHYARRTRTADWALTDLEELYVNLIAESYRTKTNSSIELDNFFTNADGELSVYTHLEFDFEEFFRIIKIPLQQYISSPKHLGDKRLFWSITQNPFVETFKTSLQFEDAQKVTKKGFEHEMTSFLCRIHGKAYGTSTAYINMKYVNGIVEFYTRGPKNADTVGKYHFIPFKETLDKLRDDGKIPETFFRKKTVDADLLAREEKLYE